MNKENVPIRGVAPEGDPQTLAQRQRALRIQKDILDRSPGQPGYLDLVPEPDNPYDSHAVAVYTTLYGVRQQLGYLPQDLAYTLGDTTFQHFATVQQIVGGQDGKYFGIRVQIRQRREK